MGVIHPSSESIFHTRQTTKLFSHNEDLMILWVGIKTFKQAWLICDYGPAFPYFISIDNITVVHCPRILKIKILIEGYAGSETHWKIAIDGHIQKGDKLMLTCRSCAKDFSCNLMQVF